MLLTRFDSSPLPAVPSAAAAGAPERLRRTVDALLYPRHLVSNSGDNHRARDWLLAAFAELGYAARPQGRFGNVLATPRSAPEHGLVLLGAHYDTVPGTPGADDNNSAIAVCLELAHRLRDLPDLPVIFAIFNGEEDGMLGSSEFVRSLGPAARQTIREAHIFEMVGYFSREPGSQLRPAGLPIALPDRGDFIGLLSNSDSNAISHDMLHRHAYRASPVGLVTLHSYFGIEHHFRDLLRSDHSPFWAARIPTLLWTDTANFRNPHYHMPSDTTDTLDFVAMAEVVEFALGRVLAATAGD